MGKNKKWWQKSVCYDVKFLEKFFNGRDEQKEIKIIDILKIQEKHENRN